MIKTYFVVGPTASGKTEYAIKLAESLGGEIVSADSMQIYKFMNIGSAKPTEEERKRVRHHLVDIIDPREPFSVVDYQKLAIECIIDIDRRGKIPIVCGGTGLYVNSLVYDMDFSAPEGDDAYRQEIFERAGRDPQRLHSMLAELDGEAASDIHPNNVKRMLRAVERLEKGEGKIARFKDATKPSAVIEPVMTGLLWERQELYKRIDKRVDLLYEQGLLSEVAELMKMGLTSRDVAMKGIGYKEIIDCIEGGGRPEDAAEQIKLNTRHYAKRQMIWFRRYPQIEWIRMGQKV